MGASLDVSKTSLNPLCPCNSNALRDPTLARARSSTGSVAHSPRACVVTSLVSVEPLRFAQSKGFSTEDYTWFHDNPGKERRGYLREICRVGAFLGYRCRVGAFATTSAQQCPPRRHRVHLPPVHTSVHTSSIDAGPASPHEGVMLLGFDKFGPSSRQGEWAPPPFHASGTSARVGGVRCGLASWERERCD